ncbi:unnamed protein product [Mytilus coruscus]|uniref:Endonuclease/exonuclease/phosphatase domain-containing protein n=1 Tax=Mytilus coruscus TaxID=42192 RepID=A0A6J8B7C6_MYTCO|nr:unnamed protein product [Mytilus coruscus]
MYDLATEVKSLNDRVFERIDDLEKDFAKNIVETITKMIDIKISKEVNKVKDEFKTEVNTVNKRTYSIVDKLRVDFNNQTRNDTNIVIKMLKQVYMYQNIGKLYICGDFNARCGDMQDFIEGVDDVQIRAVIDDVLNRNGEMLIEFLVDCNLCMLNGRIGKQNYTNISSKGKSVKLNLPVKNKSKIYQINVFIKNNRKPYWNDELQDLWDKVCKEKDWTGCKTNAKSTLRSIYVQRRKNFDTFNRKSKRRYQLEQQNQLHYLKGHNSKDFWKSIGKLGLANEPDIKNGVQNENNYRNDIDVSDLNREISREEVKDAVYNAKL